MGLHYVTTIGAQIMATGIIWLFVIRIIILAEAGERGGRASILWPSVISVMLTHGLARQIMAAEIIWPWVISRIVVAEAGEGGGRASRGQIMATQII